MDMKDVAGVYWQTQLVTRRLVIQVCTSRGNASHGMLYHDFSSHWYTSKLN